MFWKFLEVLMNFKEVFSRFWKFFEVLMIWVEVSRSFLNVSECF